MLDSERRLLSRFSDRFRIVGKQTSGKKIKGVRATPC
jgi:hypothetical protein